MNSISNDIPRPVSWQYRTHIGDFKWSEWFNMPTGLTIDEFRQQYFDRFADGRMEIRFLYLQDDLHHHYHVLRKKVEELVFDPIQQGGRTEAEILAQLERVVALSKEALWKPEKDKS